MDGGAQRGGGTSALPAGTADQLERIEQAVESMTVEVERISEAQRSLARLQHASIDEQAALPPGSYRG